MEYRILSKTITFDVLEKYKNDFVHCYTRGTDSDGNDFDFTLESDNEDIMIKFTENIYLLGETHGFNANNLVMVKQMHTDYIKKVTEDDLTCLDSYKNLPVFDAMITNVKGVTLATKHADCVPVYLVDPVKKAIGLAHSGWKGTLDMIAAKTVRKMKDELQCEEKNIICVIGPSICPKCYNVQEDVRLLFINKLPCLSEYIDKVSTGYKLDLKGVIQFSLINCGITPENIYVCNLCTSCNNDVLHSHRASKGKCGRSLALLGLR